MFAQYWQYMFKFMDVSLVPACQRNVAQRRGSYVFESINNAELYVVSFSEDAPDVSFNFFVLRCVMLRWLFTELQLCYDIIGLGHVGTVPRKGIQCLTHLS